MKHMNSKWTFDVCRIIMPTLIIILCIMQGVICYLHVIHLQTFVILSVVRFCAQTESIIKFIEKNKLGINAFYQLVCMPCCMICLHIIYPLIKILITSQYIQYVLFAIKIYGSEK